jgi:phosphate/sulfate permease
VLSKHHHHVANAMGPFSAVYFTWKHNAVAVKNPDIGSDMYWILALGITVDL